MPELPEVETVKVGLGKLLPGKKIASVQYDWDKSFPNNKHDVDGFLVGSKVQKVRRRAKVLMIDLSTEYSLVIHLKMTGQLVFVGDERFGAGHPTDSLIGSLPDKSTRIIFCLSASKGDEFEINARKQRSAQGNVQEVRRTSTGVDDMAVTQKRWQSFGLCPEPGQCDAHLYFNDQRKFGWVRLIPTVEIPNIDFFKKVGPEPLGDDFKFGDFKKQLEKRKNSMIKAALLDQTVVAGIGNIYADESLYMAKIHPSTRVKDVSETKLKSLYEAIREVLNLSIEKGGSSDRNYVDAEGKRGSYLGFAKVFRREGKPCERCGSEIIKIKVAGRGTHICPKCQKEPK
ncbi:hypothetical protein KC950_03870 [Candidatus Saccharibacteria bacterium]|nr:hypothetical protein [Candidatus Saccharibacteria bacterium]